MKREQRVAQPLFVRDGHACPNSALSVHERRLGALWAEITTALQANSRADSSTAADGVRNLNSSRAPRAAKHAARRSHYIWGHIQGFARNSGTSSRNLRANTL